MTSWKVVGSLVLFDMICLFGVWCGVAGYGECGAALVG